MKRCNVYVVAEAGVNHNGDPEAALRLVDLAAASGADAVKFQTFRAEELVTPDARKASYQEAAIGAAKSQLEMLRQLELDEKTLRSLHDRCDRNGIAFLSTPFDEKSLDFLLDLGMDFIKVPSGEITNLPYLRAVGARRRDIVLSTGMCELEEVEAALLALESAGTPRTRVTLLHCNTQYPTPVKDANLRAVKTLAEAFPHCGVGYSDHTTGIACAVAAVALGAALIEKHFTLDKTMVGPDHAASLDPDELHAMIREIRLIETALGSGVKTPSPSERKNLDIARRYLAASRPIAQGEPFSPTNLAARRTGAGGVSPMRWDDFMGVPAQRDYLPGEPIEP